MKIAIGSDHSGYEAKKAIMASIQKENLEFQDFGCFSEKSCDYPEIALRVGMNVRQEKSDRGILICGTGIGMSIAANKISGIRAAVVRDENDAILSRQHNNANIICLGARKFPDDTLISLVKVWLMTDFSREERHIRRILQIAELEKGTH